MKGIEVGVSSGVILVFRMENAGLRSRENLRIGRQKIDAAVFKDARAAGQPSVYEVSERMQMGIYWMMYFSFRKIPKFPIDTAL